MAETGLEHSGGHRRRRRLPTYQRRACAEVPPPLLDSSATPCPPNGPPNGYKCEDGAAGGKSPPLSFSLILSGPYSIIGHFLICGRHTPALADASTQIREARNPQQATLRAS